MGANRSLTWTAGVGRRRRGGTPIHGWLIIDKALGLSSSAVVGRARRLTNAAKIGHAGTLDPLASGVLPIALGEATKTVAYTMDYVKKYSFTIRWGEERTTDDGEGEVVETSDVRPTEDDIKAAFPSFLGDILQVPPVFSAIKVNGRRSYDLARKDQAVALPPRRVHVHDIKFLSSPDADHAAFQVTCGKGTYIRSLARDLARALGTCGHVSALRRTAVGPFSEAAAISLDKLETLLHSAPLIDLLLPLETALADIPALNLTEAEAQCIRHGQAVPVLPVVNRSQSHKVTQDTVVCAMAERTPVALARIKGGEIRPLRVFNL
jgi:tRNA pseudouridine55 synthase